MGIILWLIVGGIIGWLASMIMRTDAQQGILLNIVVGIVGAFIGGLIFSGGSINNAGLTLYSFLVSLLGAVSCWRSSTWYGADRSANDRTFHNKGRVLPRKDAAFLRQRRTLNQR